MLLNCILFSTSAHSQVKKLYLHPKTVAREKQTKFIDSIRFIPLEVKDGIDLRGRYNINVTKNYILVVDYLNKTLLVYSKDGKFVKKINYKKVGDNMYPSYSELSNNITFFGSNKNYSLTPKDHVQIKLDWNNPRNKKYFKKYSIDLSDPAFTIKSVIPDKQDILRVNHFYGEYYIQGQISVSPLYKDSVDHEIKLYRNNQLVKAYFPYNRINEPRFLFTNESVGFQKVDTSNIFFVTRPFCDTIYKMEGDSLFAAYHLVMPLENSLPASFFTKPFKNKTERDNFYQNNGWMYHQIYNYYENPRFIFFVVSYFSNSETYVYEKQTATTYKARNIRADTGEYNLQLLSDFGAIRRGDTFYKPQKAGDLITFFEKNKHIPVPKDLQTFLNSKPPAITPVIVAFKFKSSL